MDGPGRLLTTREAVLEDKKNSPGGASRARNRRRSSAGGAYLRKIYFLFLYRSKVLICYSRDTNETFCSEKPHVAIILRLSEKWPQNDWTTSVEVDDNNIEGFTVSSVMLAATWSVIAFDCLVDSEDVTLVEDWSD